MPTVHNGIGTWYYGKNDIHRRVDYCPHCKRPGELESYDTTLYFVVFFVPVIPLGGKRIIEQCPSCRRHGVIKMKEWQRTKETAVAEAREQLDSNPTDLKTQVVALATSVQFQDESLLDDTLPALTNAPDLGASELLDLANALSYFSRWSEAEQACRAAIERENTPAVNRKLAFILLKQGRPAEAEPLLDSIVNEGQREYVGLIDLLIQGYQGQGMHTEALAVMDRADAAFPELARDKDWKKRRKVSVRHERSGKKVASGYLNESGKVGTSTGGWTSRVPKILFPTVVVLGLCVYLSSALWIGSHRKVYLVSGAMKPYAVSINGVERKLNPGQISKIFIPEGDITLQVLDPRFPSEPMVCRIDTPFFSRPFARKTYVLNPDQSAVVLWEEMEYVPRGKPQPEGQSGIHVAKLLHEFSKVDHEFAPFPPTLTVKQNQRASRTRVDLVSGLNGLGRLQLALRNLDEAGQLAYARRRLALDPSDTWTLGWYVSRLPTNEALTFLKVGLGDRPVNVEWHRFYQGLMEEAHPEHDLTPDYRKLVSESGRSPDALYLLARVSERQEAVKLLEEAARAEPPSTNAIVSLGFRNMAAGRFKEAVSYLNKVSPQLAQDSQENMIYLAALEAAGAHDKLGVLLQQLEQAPGLFWYARIFRVKDLVAQGKDKSARELIAQTRAENDRNPRTDEAIRRLNATRSCAQGDAMGYLKTLSADELGHSFYALVLNGKLRDAAKSIDKKAHAQDAAFHALVYLQAMKRKDQDLAKTEWTQLIDSLEHGNREHHELAKILSGKKPVDVVALKELPIDPENKRVFLYVVAQRFPNADKEIGLLARRLDFQRDEVSLCLKKLDGK